MCIPVNNGPTTQQVTQLQTPAGYATFAATWDKAIAEAEASGNTQRAADLRRSRATFEAQNGVGPNNPATIAAATRTPTITDAMPGARAAGLRALTGRGRAWALNLGDGTVAQTPGFISDSAPAAAAAPDPRVPALNQGPNSLGPGFVGDVTTPAGGDVTSGGISTPARPGPLDAAESVALPIAARRRAIWGGMP
jgi:hypothetical protein